MTDNYSAEWDSAGHATVGAAAPPVVPGQATTAGQPQSPPAPGQPPPPASSGNYGSEWDTVTPTRHQPSPTPPLPKPSGATPPDPPPTQGDEDSPDRGTTFRGVMGAATRGLAPVATGAAVGAALGAPFGGVGAVPGAVVGATAMAGTEIALGVWNTLADHFNLPKAATPQQATDWLMDKFGVAHPQTAIERGVEAVSSAVGGTASLAKAGELLAAKAANPVAKRVGQVMAERPAAQTVGATTGAIAGQTARELGAPDWASDLISMGVGGLTPTGLPGRPSVAAIEAHNAGLVLHPAEISHEPGFITDEMAAAGGKVKTLQAAARKNQPTINQLAAQDVGIAGGLTPGALQGVRDRAAQVYKEIGQQHVISARQNPGPPVGTPGTASPQTTPITPITPQARTPLEAQYQHDIDHLTDRLNPQGRQHLPTTKDGTIDKLKKELGAISAFSPEEGLNFIQNYRREAQQYFLRQDSPKARRRAIAYMRAADAIEDLMDRQLTNIGRPDLVSRYQAARTLIAKTYAIEGSMIPGTNNVSARKLAQLQAVNRAGQSRARLTGRLKTIADAYNNFPHSLAMPRGPAEGHSVLDQFALLAGVATGHGGAAILGHIARPASRKIILSRPYQKAQVRSGQIYGASHPSVPPSGYRFWHPGINPALTAGTQGGEPDLSPYIDGDSGYDAIYGGIER